MKTNTQTADHLPRFSEDFTPELHAAQDALAAAQDALAAALAVLKSRGLRAEVTVKVLGDREVSRDNF